jgi:hypothetical protein
MAKLFSKRNRPERDRLREDIPELVRSRILTALDQMHEMGFGFDFGYMVEEVEKLLKREYGGLVVPKLSHHQTRSPAISHFFACEDMLALDFIEACFHVFHNPGQPGVDAINNIFEDEGIAYYLTPYVETIIEKPGLMLGRPMGRTLEIQRPEIIKRESEFIQKETTVPVLTLLSDVRYKGANEEFLQAHKHYRDGDYKAVLNECLKAFESVMKIICGAKGWTFNATDTAKTLIKTCLDNNLVPTFSDQQLTSLRTLLESGVPTVRNKRGGHGQGNQPTDVPQGLARYALNITAATILLLIDSAKI